MNEGAKAGFLNVYKPIGITSHDAVAHIRRYYRAMAESRKVGHAGTLDPLADGVLVICLGPATRLSQYVMRSRKVYRAEVTLGKTTTTYDAEGDILLEHDASAIVENDIRRALRQFVGELEQLPPLYSAVKYGGKRLYEYARQGRTVDRTPRRVLIDSIELLRWRNPALTLKVTCGPGTYIRSLAHDLGEALGVGAYLSGLTRLASGQFKLEDSIALSSIAQDSAWARAIISPYEALQGKPRVTLSSDAITHVCNGRFIKLDDALDSEEVFAFDRSRQLIAILEPRDCLWKPRRVFLKPT